MKGIMRTTTYPVAASNFWYPTGMAISEEHFPEKEQHELAQILANRFVNRFDVYHYQIADGTYRMRREPLTRSILMAHLRGEITLGAYALNSESQGQALIFDADHEEHWQQLVEIVPKLAQEDIPTYREASRLGGHLWFHFGGFLPGSTLRQFGLGLLAAHHIPVKTGKQPGIEVFPKQDRLRRTEKGIGPGSFIRLPFGVHRKTGERYGFYHPTGEKVAGTLRDQIRYFASPQIVSGAGLEAYMSVAIPDTQQSHLRATESLRRTSIMEVGEDAPVSERIKAAISVRDFVNEYLPDVRLADRAKGYCPIHEDTIRSFGVFEDQHQGVEKWNCFAGCGSGTVIDLWMQVHDLDFKTAIRQLAELLLD